MKLKVSKIREGAKLPVRAHPTDAGMDLFYCPAEDYTTFIGTKELRISTSSGAIIPTGLKIGVPAGYMLEIKNKSGIASKKQLVVGACVVDSGYDGEVFVNLNNIGQKTQVIEPGEKVAQAVLVPVVCCGVEDVGTSPVYDRDTSRGSGALGSTGDF